MSSLEVDVATGPFDEATLRRCLASWEGKMESGDASVWDNLAALALALVFERAEGQSTPHTIPEQTLEDAPITARIILAAAKSGTDAVRFGTCRFAIRAPIVFSEEDALEELELPDTSRTATGHIVRLPLAYDAPVSYSLRWDPGAIHADLCAVNEEQEEVQTLGLMDWVSQLAAQADNLKNLKAASKPHWTKARRELRAVLRVVHHFDRELRWQR